MYDANGNKLRKTVSGVSQDYLGGIEYKNNVVEAVYHEEGRATPSGSAWQYEYYLKDHLGNTRVIFSDTNNDGEPEILQEADYYPFGMRHDRSITATNHYLYNGKELNTDLGLDWYDYGFRWYDAELGRFPSVDPIIENFPDLTPYNYASNNPSTLIDLWGLQGYPYPNPGTSSQYLNDALNKYGKEFQKARDATIGDTERGYGIFVDEVGELYITDMVLPSDGVTSFINVGDYIFNIKNRRNNVNDKLLGKLSQIVSENNPAFYSTLYLVGIYHTHPDIGVDGNPISIGDTKAFLSTLLSNTASYATFNIGEGFFIIADDVNGGIHAFVLENVETGKVQAPLLYPDFTHQSGVAKREVNSLSPLVNGGERTTGQEHRLYLPDKLFNSGVGVYLYRKNSSTLGRLYSPTRLPTIETPLIER